MIAFAPTAVFLLWFCWGVRQDRRQFRNAVLLGLTVLSLSFALEEAVPRLADAVDADPATAVGPYTG